MVLKGASDGTKRRNSAVLALVFFSALSHPVSDEKKGHPSPFADFEKQNSQNYEPSGSKVHPLIVAAVKAPPWGFFLIHVNFGQHIRGPFDPLVRDKGGLANELPKSQGASPQIPIILCDILKMVAKSRNRTTFQKPNGMTTPL